MRRKRRLLIEVVRWPPNQRLDFLGRNGYGRCTGLQISNHDGIVELQPVTSRDCPGRCHIDLPIAAVDAVIASLSRFRFPPFAKTKARRPADGNLVGQVIYSRDGRQRGVVTAISSCRLEGCRGERLHARWPGGKRSYPCSEGCKERKDGSLQID